jgi:peptidyl-Lys metalloendopeptidase
MSDWDRQIWDILLGPAFFGAPATGVDTQGGIIVHEVSHLAFGSEDYCRTMQGVLQCAPCAAVNSADTYEYYAEESAEGNGP